MSSKFTELYKKKCRKKARKKDDCISHSSSKESHVHIAKLKTHFKDSSKSPGREFKDKFKTEKITDSKNKLSKTASAKSSLKTVSVIREDPSTSAKTLTKINHKDKKEKKCNTENFIKNIHQKRRSNKTNQSQQKKTKKWKGKQPLCDMASSSTTDFYNNDSASRGFMERCNIQPAMSSQKIHQSNHRKGSTKDVWKNDQKEVPELPGFYYDKEKKKYFKILPNTSCIGSAVTRSGIQTREKEEARKSSLLNHAQSSIGENRTKSLYDSCLPCLTCHLQQGKFSARGLDYKLHQMRLKCINKNPQTKIKIYADSRRDWLERLEHASQLEMTENKHIVGLYSIKESMIQRILWLKLTEKPKSSPKDKLSLNIDPSPSCRYYQSAVKIASMCLIDKDSVLYTGMVYTGTPESLVFIKNLGEGSSRYEVYSLGQKATWACAWNSHANQFSVGSEKCGLLLDVQTRRLWEISTHNSDVLCQVFSKQNGHCLYSGTRKNQIFTHDLRSISTYSVSHLTMSSSVCGLQLLQNDIHLVSSDVKGKVCLWDLRTRKIVNEYMGMKNEYLRIPVHVDSSEELVYGVDQEGYTRLWCLQTAELLKTIPPPMSTSYDLFPSVLYSKTWNDQPGNAGLLMGLGDKIYVYSDYQEDQ